MGAQPENEERFNKLGKKEQRVFAGWKVDGWVRWLEGLRGSYERRMNRMCSILESGRFTLKQGTPLKAAERDWAVISKTEMYTFSWPRGGMFIWVRTNLESHPLWGAVTGPALSRALWIWLAKKPYLVLAAPGMMFSPTEEIRDGEGWKFFRLCFAAVEEAEVDACSQRFVDGVGAFWRIRDKKVLEGIEDESVEGEMEGEGVVDLGCGMGC
jgi:DNA-binding transcriptional MocR family regulator